MLRIAAIAACMAAIASAQLIGCVCNLHAHTRTMSSTLARQSPPARTLSTAPTLSAA